MFKRSVVIKANRFKPIGKFSLDYKTVIYFTLFLCGVIIGVLLIKHADSDLNNFLSRLLVNNFNAKKSNGFLKNFCFVFFCLAILFFFNYLCSLSAVGFPFIWSILICYGAVCGIIISEFFISFGLKGIGFCLLVNIPYYAITAATLVCCCCESTKICNNIFFFLFGNTAIEKGKNHILKEFSIKYIIMCIPLAIAALISTCCFKLFSGFFTFN